MSDETKQQEPPPHPAWTGAAGAETDERIDTDRIYRCPECAEQGLEKVCATAQALGSHRRTAHGVKGEHARHRKPKAKAKKATNGNGKPVGRPRQTRVEALTAEDIFFTVVAMLFPGGAIPVQAMEPLLEWRDATQNMLDTLVSS